MKVGVSILNDPSSLVHSMKAAPRSRSASQNQYHEPSFVDDDKDKDSTTVTEIEGIETPQLKRAILFFKKYNARICLYLGTIFTCWASFTFNVYSVNFVGNYHSLIITLLFSEHH